MEDLIKLSEMVDTIDGSTHPKSACRKMAGEYYLKGDITKEDSGHCYYINKKYYKYNTGYIVYDHSLQQYVIKNTANLINGVVRVEGEKLIIGNYSDATTQVHVMDKNGDMYNCISNDIFKNTIYIENVNKGCYVHRLSFDVYEMFTPQPVPSKIKNMLPYDSRGLMGDLIKKYSKTNPVISSSVEMYYKALKDLTFGVEFETTRGLIETNKCEKLGLMALRDGSVEGLEYVTIPLQGKKGLQSLVDITEELEKYTTYDKNCSIHFHIGNLPRTEEFFLALFKVLCAIQDQMYGLFPLYKRYNFGVKRKHYTQPYPLAETIFQMDKVIDASNIKENFNILYSFLSMGQPYKSVGNSLDNVVAHPSDPGGNGKWNIRSRYHWVNLIPLLFGNKETIEFRLHTPTYNTEKIVSYLVLCTSIVNFVKENTNAILKTPNILHHITLQDIIYNTLGKIKDEYCNQLADYTYNYISSRRDFIYNESKSGDIEGNEDNFKPRSYINWGNKKTSKSIVFGKTRLRNSGTASYNVDAMRAALNRGFLAQDEVIWDVRG